MTIRRTMRGETERADKAERKANLYEIAFWIASGQSQWKEIAEHTSGNVRGTLYAPRNLTNAIVFLRISGEQTHTLTAWIDDMRPDATQHYDSREVARRMVDAYRVALELDEIKRAS